MGEAKGTVPERVRKTCCCRFSNDSSRPPPLLKNVVLGTSTAQSDGLSIGTENMQNSQEGKGKKKYTSNDLLWEDDLDTEGVESDTESEPWSAQDESDE